MICPVCGCSGGTCRVDLGGGSEGVCVAAGTHYLPVCSACPTPVAALRVVLPLKIVSIANQREHFRVAGARKKSQRDTARATVLAYARPELKAAPAWRVTFTRLGRGLLDDDNLAGAFKATRDGVALALGVDDGNRERIRFRYRQERCQEPSAVVFIEPQAAAFPSGEFASRSVLRRQAAQIGESAPTFDPIGLASPASFDRLVTDLNALEMKLFEGAHQPGVKPRNRSSR